MKRYKFFISFLFIVFTGAAHAQGPGGSFDIILTPEFPGASEKVTAEVKSAQFNVNGTKITWILNGKKRLDGLGEKKFTFITGGVGSATTLRTEINTPDFGLIARDLEIRPSDVDILWEADTYTPPFYKGKALPTSQSFVKMLAVPHFASKSGKIASNTLVYNWKKTYTPNPNDSGLGKNVYLYRGNYSFNEDKVETTVSTGDKALSINKKTRVSIYEPKIVFYENNPLLGVRYENSLGGNFDLKEKEVTLTAIPYFFSLNNNADFLWLLDGKKLEINPDNKAQFTLRKPEQGSGRSSISLKISNTGYDLQEASKSIGISYAN